MRYRWFTFLLLFAALTGPAFADAATRFGEHVDYLADPDRQGRGVGYEGLEQAADYIRAQFQQIGLEPAFLANPGPENTDRRYFQSFDLDLPLEATTQQLRLKTGSETHRFNPGQHASALGFSGEGEFAGRPVFVGYAIDAPDRGYDSFAELGEDGLAGRIAVAFRFEPMDEDGRSRWAGEDGDAESWLRMGRRRQWTDHAHLRTKARRAAEHGAEALLIVNPPRADAGGVRTAAETALPGVDIPVMHIGSDAFRRILADAGRDPGSALTAYQDRADRGADEPDELPNVRLAGEVQLEQPTDELANVGGLLPGRGDLADELVILGAHYDHLGMGEVGSMARSREPAVHPGADDNASGTAGVLVAARQLARWAENHPDQPRRTLLVVAFTGEERGLLGSRHLVNQPRQLAANLDQAVAMINLDMVGRLRGQIYLFGTASASNWNDLIQHARQQTELGSTELTTFPSSGVSDHTPFQLTGVPALHLFTGMHEDYHRPTDTAEKINDAGGVTVARLSAELTRHLLTTGEPPQFTESEPKPDVVTAGQPDEVFLGIVSRSFAPSPDGVPVEQVLPGSPADQAGLEAGDTITAYQGESIGSFQQLVDQLGSASPGDAVTLTIERDGEAQDLSVPLGSR
ncbi:MAG: M20/M25/M40 family metallo-hydrolase [Phycisphaeraceae bacterium]